VPAKPKISAADIAISFFLLSIVASFLMPHD
jgi:hypothetical protein